MEIYSVQIIYKQNTIVTWGQFHENVNLRGKILNAAHLNYVYFYVKPISFPFWTCFHFYSTFDITFFIGISF